MGYRTCYTCRERFTPAEGEKNINCPSCREKKRNKACRECREIFRDDSAKNTRRYCDKCQAERVQVSTQRAKVSDRLDRRRKRRVRKGAGGRADDLSTMRPFTQSWWGRVGEVLFFHLYPDAQDAVDEYGNRNPYDADHRTLGRINVKTSKERASKHGKPSWSFQIDGLQETCDHAFLIGFDAEQKHVVRVWSVAKEHLPDRLKVMTPDSREYESDGFELSADEVLLLDRRFQVVLRDADGWAPGGKDTKHVPEYDRIIIGRLGEALYQKLYLNSDHVAGRDPVATYDFVDEGGTTVNVRARRPNKGREYVRWTFFRTDGCTAQEYFLLGLDAKCQKVLAAFRIPEQDLPQHGMSVSADAKRNSKWNKYRVDGFPRLVSDLTSVDDFDALHVEIQSATATGKSDGEIEVLLRRAFGYHRLLGFPYPSIPTEPRLKSDVVRIRTYNPKGKFLHQDNAGLGLGSAYMPHRFDTRNASADFSAVDAFHDDDRLMRALRFSLKGKAPGLTQSRLRGALTALNRTPTQFRPTVTHALVEAYSKPGDTVFDPCAGWGGRLMGTLVAGRRYVGVEPWKATCDCLYRMGARLCEHLEIDRSRVRLIESEVEDADLGGVSAEFALTSPPYVGQERYGSGVWKDVDDWERRFLVPMFQQVRAVLIEGARFAVNVRDVSVGRATLPLERMVVQGAEAVGYRLEDCWKMEIGSFGGQVSGRHEPILVFRR